MSKKTIIKSRRKRRKFAEPVPQKAGVYQIRNTINNKKYVGATKNFHRRRKEHFNVLERGDHNSPYLQNAVNKYGIENFEFEVLATCPEHPQEYRFKLEQWFLDTGEFDYNMEPNVTMLKGKKSIVLRKFTEEQAKEIRWLYRRTKEIRKSHAMVKEIARLYGTVNSVIHNVVTNKGSYSEITGEIERPDVLSQINFDFHQHHDSKLTKEEVLDIRELFELGFTKSELSREYGISIPSTVKIINKQSYKYY